jgi:hypothetical protein
VPGFVYKWLKATAATGYIRFGAEPNRRVQDGFKRYWLCRQCEQKFSRWETEFANEVFYPFNDGRTARASYEPWLMKFCVSVSWRVLTLFFQEGHLKDFPDDLQEKVKNALRAWHEFLSDLRPDLGPHEQHLLPWDVVSSTDPRMPLNINRYILRSVDIDVVEGGHTAFVYSKLGRFMILGFISMKNTKHWDGGTRIYSNGTIEPRISFLHISAPMFFRKLEKREGSCIRHFPNGKKPRWSKTFFGTSIGQQDLEPFGPFRRTSNCLGVRPLRLRKTEAPKSDCETTETGATGDTWGTPGQP